MRGDKLNAATAQIKSCIDRRLVVLRAALADPAADHDAVTREIEQLRVMTPFYKNEQHAHDAWVLHIAGCYEMVRDPDAVFDGVRALCDELNRHIGVLGAMGFSARPPRGT